MTPLLWLVVQMGVFTWLGLLLASLLRAKGWTAAGLRLALGNRAQMPEPGMLAGRADRAARNTLENFALFAPLALVAQVAGANPPLVLLGAQVFVGSRLAYTLVYLAGVPYLRTAVWALGIVGMGMMVAGLR